MRSDTPSDPSIEYLETTRGPVAFSVEGRGPFVLALHGCPGSMRDFRWLAPVLSKAFTVMRLDLPGFGQTPLRVDPSAKLSKRALFVASIAEQFGLKNAGIIGHSAGGVLAMEVAARFPGRFSHLGLIASPGLRPHASIRRHPISRHFIPTLLNVKPFRYALGPWLKKGFIKAGFPEDLSVESLHQAMQIVQEISFREIRQCIPMLRQPTFVAWAEDDAFVEGEISRELARTCPAGPRLCFHHGGHHIQKHMSVEIGEALIEWMRGYRGKQVV
ncbi:MAG: alpha/beta hydrolase [Myxococcota bacterium]|nr:alpha/beta hydrolase [Myxococcota bacterium]